MAEIKQWCLKRRGFGNVFPMGRWHSHSKEDGKWVRRLCVSRSFKEAVTFDTKEEALYYLSGKYDKYKNDIKKWTPIKCETLFYRQMASDDPWVLRK